MAATYRVKCSKCGAVYDLAQDAVCGKCSNPLSVSPGGSLQLYRMGSPIGIAVGFGLYIDGQPCGYLANKQSIIIPLAFGVHNIHITCGMTRRCNDLSVTVTPEAPNAYAKAYIKPGMWTNTIFVQSVAQSDMPPM